MITFQIKGQKVINQCYFYGELTCVTHSFLTIHCDSSCWNREDDRSDYINSLYEI